MKNSGNRHIIEKQVLQLEVKGQEGARNAQSRLSRLFHEKLLPIISKTFDEVSPANAIHRIEKLELDLGDIPLSQLDKGLVNKFDKLFKKAVEEAIKKVEKRTVLMPATSSEFTGSRETAIEASGAKPEKAKPPSATNQSASELFFYFLEFGRLPWWAAPSPGLLAVVVKELIQYQPDIFKERLKTFLQNEKIRKRIITMLPDESIQEILALFIIQKILVVFKEEWQTAFFTLAADMQISTAKIRFYFWEALITGFLFEVDSGYPEQIIIQNTFGFLIQQEKIKQEKIIEKLGALKQDKFIKIFKGSTELKSETKSPTDENRSVTSRSDSLSSLPSTPDRILSSLKSFNESKDIYVNNAGLILIAAYFPAFFKQLGYLKEKEFISKALQHRATLMLQFMVDSSVEMLEYNMVLNKLCCGIPISEPIEPQDALSNEEQDACHTLIETIISYAPGLGAISVEGFQHSFIQREGVLSRKNNYWTLNVQRETYDIVLNKLEWNYNIVKASWMESAIFVEW